MAGIEYTAVQNYLVTLGARPVTATASLGYFNVMDYGAVADAATDDTAAIQSAIDAANTAGGGKVHFPQGTYKIIGGLTVAYTGTTGQITLSGCGKFVSTLSLAASGTEDLLSIDAWNTTARSFRLEHLGFVLASGTGADGISVLNASRGEINNCYVSAFAAGAGIKFDAANSKNSSLNRVVGSHVDTCQDGIWSDLAATSTSYNEANIISDCSLKSNTRYDIHFSNSGSIASKADAHFVHNTDVTSVATGTHGLYVDDDVSGFRVANTDFSAGATATEITIGASSTSSFFSNVTVDGGFTDSSSTAEFTNCSFTKTGQTAVRDSVTSYRFRNGVEMLTGSGSPEGVTTAAIGTTYHRSDGSPGISAYVKESGAGNTGWSPLTTGTATLSQSWSMNTGSIGTYWFGGFYDHVSGANDFNPAVAAYGTANAPHGSHIYFVAAAGATDTEITVAGTSIDDTTGLSAADSEVVQLTDASANSKYETSKKWVGAVSITKTAGTDRLCNYGQAKYWDNLNTNFTLTGGEFLWIGGANNSFEMYVRHHKATGWTYNAGSTATPPTPLFSASDATTGLGTFNNTNSGEADSWKRIASSPVAVEGQDSEGIIIEVVTSSASQFESGTITMNYTSG